MQQVNGNAPATADFPNEQTGWGLIVKNHNGAVVFKACRLEEIAVEPA